MPDWKTDFDFKPGEYRPSEHKKRCHFGELIRADEEHPTEEDKIISIVFLCWGCRTYWEFDPHSFSSLDWVKNGWKAQLKRADDLHDLAMRVKSSGHGVHRWATVPQSQSEGAAK